jgi:hypothetical protein
VTTFTDAIFAHCRQLQRRLRAAVANATPQPTRRRSSRDLPTMAVHVAGSAVARQALSSWGSPQHPLLAWWAASSASAGVGVLGVASAAAAAAFAASSSSDPHRDGRSNEAAATSSSSWRLWRQHLQHRRLPTAACEGAAVADGAPKIPATLRQRVRKQSYRELFVTLPNLDPSHVALFCLSPRRILCR